ncbi:alkane hydroxylase MAH1-like protein [Tanacetum coccineum]
MNRTKPLYIFPAVVVMRRSVAFRYACFDYLMTAYYDDTIAFVHLLVIMMGESNPYLGGAAPQAWGLVKAEIVQNLAGQPIRCRPGDYYYMLLINDNDEYKRSITLLGYLFGYGWLSARISHFSNLHERIRRQAGLSLMENRICVTNEPDQAVGYPAVGADQLGCSPWPVVSAFPIYNLSEPLLYNMKQSFSIGGPLLGLATSLVCSCNRALPEVFSKQQSYRIMVLLLECGVIQKYKQEEIATERALEEHEVVEHHIVNRVYEYEIELKISNFKENRALSGSLKKEAKDVLAQTGGTFLFKGPWLSGMDMFLTTNTSDIHHIMTKNFANYPRGHKFRNMLDILGDGISNTDGELWEFQRKTIMSLLKLPSFHSLYKKTIWNKVENGLLPVLDYVVKQGATMDLQEIFQRFTFDTICTLLFDHDPQSMSTEFPHIPCEKALSDMEEVIFQEYFKLSTALVREFKVQLGTSGDPNKFLRDNLLNLMLAGRDTTSVTLSWLFYLLGKNPIVEDKIREELQTKLETNTGKKWKDFILKESQNLVYLHGALCEVLRLYPAIPFQYKSPIKPDILPSGNQVDPESTIILCYYNMGRMKSIWGEDCMELKPERWVSATGEIIHQPSYKFPAFNVGPRTCLGKNISFFSMKIVAATIIHHYHVELVEGHPAVPSASFMLEIKHGLKVRLTKRRELKI